MSIFKIIVAILTIIVMFFCFGVCVASAYFGYYDLSIVSWFMTAMFAYFTFNDYMQLFKKELKG